MSLSEGRDPDPPVGKEGATLSYPFGWWLKWRHCQGQAWAASQKMGQKPQGEGMGQSELAKGWGGGLRSGDVSSLAVLEVTKQRLAHASQGYDRGSPASGGCQGCLTAQAPSDLKFSEAVDHV